jgi:cell division protease FtsH
VHKATIIPRGRALGMVMQLPERDKLSMSFEQMTSRLAILMGGPRGRGDHLRQGEDHLGRLSPTSTRRQRLARHGHPLGLLRPKLGTVAYGENQDEVFLGHSVSRTQNVSEETARIIDEEVKRLVQGGYDEAKRILTEKIEDLHTLAKALLEYETLTGDEITRKPRACRCCGDPGPATDHPGPSGVRRRR